MTDPYPPAAAGGTRPPLASPGGGHRIPQRHAPPRQPRHRATGFAARSRPRHVAGSLPLVRTDQPLPPLPPAPAGASPPDPVAAARSSHGSPGPPAGPLTACQSTATKSAFVAWRSAAPTSVLGTSDLVGPAVPLASTLLGAPSLEAIRDFVPPPCAKAEGAGPSGIVAATLAFGEADLRHPAQLVKEEPGSPAHDTGAAATLGCPSRTALATIPPPPSRSRVLLRHLAEASANDLIGAIDDCKWGKRPVAPDHSLFAGSSLDATLADPLTAADLPPDFPAPPTAEPPDAPLPPTQQPSFIPGTPDRLPSDRSWRPSSEVSGADVYDFEVPMRYTPSPAGSEEGVPIAALIRRAWQAPPDQSPRQAVAPPPRVTVRLERRVWPSLVHLPTRPDFSSWRHGNQSRGLQIREYYTRCRFYNDCHNIMWQTCAIFNRGPTGPPPRRTPPTVAMAPPPDCHCSCVPCRGCWELYRPAWRAPAPPPTSLLSAPPHARLQQ